MSETPAKTRVVLVDDHPVFREPLGTLIDMQEDMVVVDQAGSCAAALELVGGGVDADVFIIDLDLGDGSGVDVVQALADRGFEERVLVLTGMDDPLALGRVIEIGANAAMRKTAQPSDILQAVRRIAAGESAMDPAEALLLMRAWERSRRNQSERRGKFGDLTPRELEILQQLATGKSDQDLANALFISVKTAHTHVRNILAKLECDSRLQAVLAGLKAGVIAIPD
jgi:DNA-binding NarL/FixJ family response regulator